MEEAEIADAITLRLREIADEEKQLTRAIKALDPNKRGPGRPPKKEQHEQHDDDPLLDAERMDVVDDDADDHDDIVSAPGTIGFDDAPAVPARADQGERGADQGERGEGEDAAPEPAPRDRWWGS